MTELTRYDWGKRDDGEWDILPFTDGDYVKYADVAHLEQQAARLANLPALPEGWGGPWSGCPDGNLWGYRAGRLCDFALDCGFNNAQFLAALLNTCYPPAPGQEGGEA